MARGQQVFSPPCITLPPSFTTPPPACTPNVKPFLRFHAPCLRYFPPTPLRLHTREFHEATNRLSFSDLIFLDHPPTPATMPNGPNDLLKEPLREARPGPFALSLQLFGRASVASRMVGRPFSPCRPRFLGLFGPPLHAR